MVSRLVVKKVKSLEVVAVAQVVVALGMDVVYHLDKKVCFQMMGVHQ